MKSNVQKLVDELTFIANYQVNHEALEKEYRALGPQERDFLDRRKESLDKNRKRLREAQAVSESLLGSIEVQNAVEQLPNWEKLVHNLKLAICSVHQFIWHTKKKSAENAIATIKKAIELLDSDEDSKAYLNDPIIMRRIQVLERVHVDKEFSTITVDGSIHHVEEDVITLFIALRDQYPIPVRQKSLDIRKDRMKLSRELSKFVHKDKSGLTLTLRWQK